MNSGGLIWLGLGFGLIAEPEDEQASQNKKAKGPNNVNEKL